MYTLAGHLVTYVDTAGKTREAIYLKERFEAAQAFAVSHHGTYKELFTLEEPPVQEMEEIV